MSEKYRKNIERISTVVDGNYQNKIQSGYTPTDEKRKVGDKWVDADGIPWEQKDGYRVKGRLATSDITHQSWDKKCSDCESLIIKPWDRDTHKADGRCYHCQLNYELDLKFDAPIRWFAYRRLKDFKNMIAIEKEMEQWVEEFTRIRKEKVFDKTVANALANANVSMEINKNKS